MAKINWSDLSDKTTAKAALVLGPQNDPFGCNGGREVAYAKWFAAIIRDLGITSRTHLRKIHYMLVSRPVKIMMPGPAEENFAPTAVWTVYGGKKMKKGEKVGDTRDNRYLNYDHCWKILQEASKYARIHEFITSALIGDARSPEVTNRETSLARTLDKAFWIPDTQQEILEAAGINISIGDFGSLDSCLILRDAPTHKVATHQLFLSIEKSTMDDVLEDVLNEFNINFQPGQGEPTYAQIDWVFDRWDGRPIRMAYISDFDPAGTSMPTTWARGLEYRARRMEKEYGIKVDIEFTRLALTAEQVEELGLPRLPLKVTETRADKFEEKFGEGGCELDALEALYPGYLSDLVREWAEKYQQADDDYEAAMIEQHNEYNEAVTAAYDKAVAPFTEDRDAKIAEIAAIRDAYAAQIQKLIDKMSAETAPLIDDLNEINAAIDKAVGAAIPTPEPLASPNVAHDDYPILRTSRSYDRQLARYNDYKNNNE